MRSRTSLVLFSRSDLIAICDKAGASIQQDGVLTVFSGLFGRALEIHTSVGVPRHRICGLTDSVATGTSTPAIRIVGNCSSRAFSCAMVLELMSIQTEGRTPLRTP